MIHSLTMSTALGFLLETIHFNRDRIRGNKSYSLAASLAASLALFACLTGYSIAAAADRVTALVDPTHTRVLKGNVHHLAQAQYDLGAADPQTPMNDMVFLVKPSAAQQGDLEQLLSDQQNPLSPRFHQWLTPEAFGERFGLSAADLAKVSQWLKSAGFAIHRQARGGNWIAFSGTAAQASRAFHTSIHRYAVNGETHYANTGDPAVPEALSDVTGGFLGLNDFHLQPASRLVPDFNSGSSHYLAPADFSTIYDLAPLTQSGMDGTGQSIAVVGESDVLTSDLSAFRTRYGLPANTPKFILYNGIDPGANGAELEGALDLEWAGAIAPKATIYYVYGASAFTAAVYAIDLDLAPIVSISYGGCEGDYAPAGYQPLAQQANAQGITILSASGDAGPAGCDRQGSEPLATRGRQVSFPAVLPEVTSIGGSQFMEGTGSYWAGGNAANFGSALSYIPETTWNESTATGLGASGGGSSRLYSKPAWQTGPGTQIDASRDVPDVSFSAAGHDAYLINYAGSIAAVAGTSCGTPSMAGMVALLNQYQVANKRQTAPGLGNINPQLYRLAQLAPSAFHDITSGNTMVPCAQGSTDCATGSFGYPAGPGYDMATGLGSIDANNLFTQWNTASNGVTVTLSSSAVKGTLNDTAQLTATVSGAAGTPTGTVNFSILGGPAIGSASLSGSGAKQTASVSFPLYELGAAGTFEVAAQYSGDASFSPGGATLRIQATNPIGAAAIVVSAPNTVWPALDLDAQGDAWTTTITLREIAGTAAILTGFTIDGQAQNLPQYFPSPNILPHGSLTANVILRNLSTPLTHTYGFTGVDAAGFAWSRQAAVNYLAVQTQNQYSLTVTPVTVTQNTANPSCPFQMQLSIDDSGGFTNLFTSLYAGTSNLSSHLDSVFGTTRLAAWGSIQGTVCLNGITPPASEYVYAIRSDGNVQQNLVNFAQAPTNPIAITIAPASISLSSASVSQPAQATLQVGISDKTQQWTASVYPNNRTAGWLSLSQLTGTGPAQITLTASGYGYEPGAYRALIVIQAANAVPQFINVPVMFVVGAASGMSITGVTNVASGQPTGAPGMLLSVYGTGLAGAEQTTSGNPLPYSAGSVTATVNNLAAPLLYVSPTQLNIQIPYEVGAGPAVLGITNNGQAAGFQFQMAPSAPAIYNDGNGNLAGNPSVAAGGIGTLYLNGAGDVTPALLTASQAPSSTVVTPVLPLSVTVGGVPALLQYAALAPLTIGTTQVNFYVPASAAPGPQPVVVTVGGNASLPVNVTVQAPAGK
jgi:uncharacterized protein (TIGR03437 family)